MSLELSKAKDYVAWMARKIELNHLSSNTKNKKVKRGEVYWCEFGLNVGSEMSKTTPRPAVIIQNNRGNNYSPNTIVVPVTHDQGSGTFLVPITTQIDSSGKIILDGKVNTSNIVCISKARLQKYIATLPASDMRAIDNSLSQMIGLKPYYDDLFQKFQKCRDKLKSISNNANGT